MYSTEVSRSVRLGKVRALTVPPRGTSAEAALEGRVALEGTKVTFGERRAGALNDVVETKELRDMPVVPSIIYGHVDVRTDGKTILCAVRDEVSHDWDIATFRARFGPVEDV